MASENHAIISLILYCICLKLSPILFFAFPLIAVFISIICLYYVPFQFVEHKVKWIRRELRLLRTLSEDVKGVLKSRAEIDMKASRLWDSKINPEMTELLNPTEAGWIARTDDLAFLAEIVFEWFQECNKRRQVDKLYFLSHNHSALLDEMKSIEKEIKAHLEKKSMVDICGTLERSRAHIQSLQDRLKSASSKKQDCPAAALISSILEKENKNRHSVDGMEEKIQLIELQLSFLFAFFKDLKGLDFQSETEKAWVEEASEIIVEAQCAIETFIQGPERRFLAFTNWMAPRHKLMEDIIYGFFELLNRKERYCLKFIRRDPSKSVTRSPRQKEIQISNPTDVSRVEDKKKYWLDLMQNNLTGEYHQVKTLCDQWEEMHRHLEAAKAIEGVYHSREAWKDQMEKTTKKAENIIDDYIQTTEEERKKEGTYILNSLFDTTTEHFYEYFTIGFLFTGNSSISERTNAAKLSKENEQMRKVNLVLEKSIKLYRIEIREESTSVVGLEEDIHELISTLTDDGKPIVSVVGMRGIGKTTLAEKVYNHGAISTHFNTRHWVSLSQESFGNTLPNEDGKLILEDLEKRGEQNGGSWIEKVRHFLGKEKNLLVLDNISTKEVWDTLNVEFPERINGSKIMVTTRHKSVASQADQSSTQRLLRLRTKEESWKLFTQMVHLPPEIPPESEEIIKAKVVERCGGLPIAIFRLGYHLIRKHVTKENFLRELESIEHHEAPWREAVENEELPDQEMKCLGYIIRLFPRDYEIPARRVVASWVAEELVEDERVAEMIVGKLIDRYIIQVLERKLNRKIKTFCLTNALREDWLQNQSSDQRLAVADKFETESVTFEIIHGKLKDSLELQNYKDLVAFLSFDVREGNKPGEDIGNFLHRGIATGCFRLLKVLDLERVFRPILPKSIGNLKDLKYLGLRWTYLEVIPSSIGNLTNLQNLDMKHTYIRKLPASIWKLQKLRHLYLNQSYRSKLVQPSVAALKNLQTLWGVFVDEESPLNNGLNRLMNLRKLKLAFQLEPSRQMVLAEWITQLDHLQSLRLRSIDEMGEPLDLHLKPLSRLKNLSSLYLFGRLKNPSITEQLPQSLNPSIMEKLPRSLTEVTLSASQLSADPMPKLGELPKLRSLCLYSGSYKGITMVCSIDGFPQLLVLKLWMLDTLLRWDVKERAMQNLRELEIRSCINLEIPTGLKHLNSLQELKLTNMPKDFTFTIQEKKWKFWGGIAYPPRITVENW